MWFREPCYTDSSLMIRNMGGTFRIPAPFKPFASYVNLPGFYKIIQNVGSKSVGICSLITDCRVIMYSFDIY
jgi:hypothetical protein